MDAFQVFMAYIIAFIVAFPIVIFIAKLINSWFWRMNEVVDLLTEIKKELEELRKASANIE